jgi:hypothetical protein
MSNNTLQKIEPRPGNNSPVQITSTWDGVRYWRNAAQMFEEGKLFCNVMTGLELLSLYKANGIQRGGDRANPQPAGLLTWEEICKKEAGISDDTARRYMDMAKVAAPRLKKLPALKNFDPFNTPFAKLAGPQREALTNAVKKLTDGKSQADFFDTLYKTGGKGTGRAPGCDNPRKNLSLSEEAALRKELAVGDWVAIWKILSAYQDKFLMLADHDVEAQVAVLEKHLAARRAWLKQPLNRRDPKAITEIFCAK